MNQCDHAVFRFSCVICFVHIFQGEVIHIHHHRHQSGPFDDVGVAINDFFFDGDQKYIHPVAVIGLAQHLMIEVYVFQIFRNDILRFELDIRLQFGGLLSRHLDFFHDHRAAGDRGDHMFGLDAVFLYQPADRFDYRRRIDDHIVLDRVGGQRQNS